MMKIPRVVALLGCVFGSPLWAGAASLSVRQAAAEIDRILEASRNAARVPRNAPISDEVFVRRLFLDLAGRIPTPHETQTFLKFEHPQKRAMLVETLMSRESYASNFFNFWADILRYKSFDAHSPVSVRFAYRKFILESLRANKPYDRFVRELLSAKGYPWETGAVGYYERDFGMPLDNMAVTSRIFLGTQIECAQCHDHPFDKWKQTDFYKLSAYTHGAVRRTPLTSTYKAAGFDEPTWAKAAFDIVFGKTLGAVEARDPKAVMKLPGGFKESDGKPGAAVAPTPLFGPPAPVKAGEDPAEAFAKWVASPKNPRFTAVIVNRLWQRVFGLGVVRNFDEIKDSSTAMIPPLETYLERLMVALGYDMKAFLSVLVNTSAYQSEVTAAEPSPEAVYYFPGPLLRRMTAEQIWDSLVALISHEPEAKNWVHEGHERALQLNRQVTDAFLACDPKELWKVATEEARLLDASTRHGKLEAAWRLEQDAVRRGSGSVEALAKLKEEVAKAQGELDQASKLVAVRAIEQFARKRGWKGKDVVVDTQMAVYKPGHSFGSQWLQRVYLPGYGPGPKTPEQVQEEAAAKKRMILAYAERIGIEPKEQEGFWKYCENLELRNRGYWGAFGEGCYRASELLSPAPRGHFLRVMGQSDRDLVENARQSASVPQAMLLMNSDLVSSSGVMAPFSPLMVSIHKEQNLADKMDAAYLALFCRKATPAEHAIWEKANSEGLDQIEDLVYALLNTQQFIFIE